MPGINAGILTNAYPLTTEQINALEKRVFETNEAFAYLDEHSKLCFTLPFGPDIIKELAWETAYELTVNSDGSLSKKVYKKLGLKAFYLKETLQKPSYDSAWVISSIESANFELADGCMLLTNDNLIFEIKEY